MKQDENLLNKIRDKDLVAIEAKYHKRCYRVYCDTIYHPRKPSKDDESPSSSAFDEVYKVFCTNVMDEIVHGKKWRTMTYLLEKYKAIASEKGHDFTAYRAQRLRARLEKSYPQLLFHRPRNPTESTIVYVKGVAIGQVIERSGVPFSSGTETESDVSPLKLGGRPTTFHLEVHALYSQALALRNSLREAPALLKDIWPPRASDLSMETSEKMIPIAMYNMLAWIIGASDDPQLESFVKVKESDHQKLVSITQDIIYIQSKCKTAPPKHYCLAMAVRHLTGSTRILELLNRFGHCVSRATVSSLETSLAELQAGRSNLVPDGIRTGVFATIVSDNIDFDESTLTGEGTTHHTNSIIIQTTSGQTNNATTAVQEARPKLAKRKHVADVDDIEIELYPKRAKVGPVGVTPAGGITDEPPADQPQTSEKSSESYCDQLFFLLRSIDEKGVLPSWTGYNTLLDKDRELIRDTIGYLPVIPASSTRYDTLYTLLNRCHAICVELKIQGVVLVCDMAIYSKAQEIRWASRSGVDSALYEKIVLRPGEFHTCMTFLAVLGKKYGSAGLKDLLIESRIVAVGSVNSVLSGKAYNRAIFAHKTMIEVMEFLRFQAFLAACDEVDKNDIVKYLKELIPLYPSAVFLEKSASATVSGLIDKYRNFCREQSEINKNFHLWSQYIEDGTLLLKFIRATRLRNFAAHLNALEEMLPHFFAFDRTNYSRYITAYLKEMKDLPNTHPYVHEQLSSGQFATQRSTHYGFSGTAHDQTIEQTINREVKSAGGLIGITLNKNAVQKWILSQGERAAILSQCERMVGLEKDELTRKDLLEGTKKRQQMHVETAIETVAELAINPFKNDECGLVHIISGAGAPDEVANDLLCSTTKGKTALKRFRSDVDADNQAFFKTIHRQNIKVFGSKERRKDKTGAEISQRRLFSRMVILGNKLKLPLRETLSYCMGPVSYPLGNEDGSLAKTQKSVLVHTILEKWPQSSPDAKNATALVVDAMAIVHSITAQQLPKTMKELSNLIFTKIRRLGLSMNLTRLDIVFDTYPDVNIKNLEHQRRGETQRTPKPIIKSSLPVPKQFNKEFLSHSKNKTALIEFLVNSWKSENVELDYDVYIGHEKSCVHISKFDGSVTDFDELRCNHVEADTRLLLHAHNAAQSHTEIVIYSPDTDVFVIALSVAELFPDPCKLYFQSKTGLINVTDLQQAMGVQTAKALLGYHIFSGCDTVSAFKGRGKRRGFELLLKSENYRIIFARIGLKFEVNNEQCEEIEKYVCHLYGQARFDSIDNARYSIFCVSAPDESMLPPCSDALNLHYRRANYQCAIHRSSLERYIDVPSPADHGWKVEDGKVSIKWMNRGSYPPELLQIDSCKCKKSKCETNQCACRRAGLSCTDLCACIDCANTIQTLQEVELQNGDADSDSDEED